MQPGRHERLQIKQLMLFFAVVYVVEGIGQARVGILSQPVTNYLKQAGWTPVEVTTYLAVLNFPWIIKPAMGLLSDLVPLFGSRRKSYLLIANVGAVIAFAWISRFTTPADLIPVLLLTSYAMAASSTVCGALLVENGQKTGQSSVFVGQQWLWFNLAIMVAALIGGELVQRLSPISALHAAAVVAAIPPIAVIVGCLTLVREDRTTATLGEMGGSLGASSQF